MGERKNGLSESTKGVGGGRSIAPFVNDRVHHIEGFGNSLLERLLFARTSGLVIVAERLIPPLVLDEGFKSC